MFRIVGSGHMGHVVDVVPLPLLTARSPPMGGNVNCDCGREKKRESGRGYLG